MVDICAVAVAESSWCMSVVTVATLLAEGIPLETGVDEGGPY